MLYHPNDNQPSARGDVRYDAKLVVIGGNGSHLDPTYELETSIYLSSSFYRFVSCSLLTLGEDVLTIEAQEIDSINQIYTTRRGIS